MKILLCTSTFKTITHGPAKFAQLLLQINERYPAHEVRILTEEIEHEIPDKIYKIQPKYPRPFHAFWPFLNNYSYCQAAFKIRKKYLFDVLLFNNAVMGYWSALKKPSDLVVAGLVHDDDYLSANLSDFNFNKKWLINIHRKPLEFLACRKMDVIIANSEYVQKCILKTYGSEMARVKKLYQSIDFSNFPFQQKDSIDTSKPIKVLFVKSDYPRGGLKLLVEALGRLEYKFEVIVIGPKLEHQSIIATYFESLDNVAFDFKGPCDQATVIAQMRASDIFSVPAHKEGLGIANIEALAAGIPVVSTNIGGIPEVLNHGNNGWLAESDTPEALANAFKNCIEYPRERRAKSKQGRAFVETHFNHEHMLEKVIALLNS